MLVLLGVDADAQPIHVVADLCTGNGIVLADAAGKDDGIHAAHGGNVAADGLLDLVVQHVRSQLCALVACSGCLLHIALVAGDTGDAQQAGLLVQDLVQLVAGDVQGVLQVVDHRGVQVTAAGAHHQAGQRGHAHRGIHNLALVNCSNGRTIAQVAGADPEVAAAMNQELQRQRDNIELIASENWVSKAVMAAMGSPLTNKYAEGYPGKRYYGGCQCVDVVEDLARERAKKLFGCEYVNVQPHSGAQANMAVMFAMLEPGDKIMGMNLDHGGHLTHGSPVNMSGKYFDVAHYGVNADGVIDYDEVLRIAKEHKPKLIVAGASAYARTIDFKRFREIADEVGAYLMVDIAHIAGLVATGLHPSPIPYAHVTTTTTHKTLRGPRGGMIMCSEEMNKKFNFNKAVFPGIQGGPLMHVIAGKAVCFKEALEPEYKTYMEQVVKNAKALCNGLKARGVKIVSGDTDNHLMLVDLSGTETSGKELEKRLDDAHVTANKNTIPNDPRSPFVTSGVRLGTPAVTTRGMKEDDMDKIAEIIAMVIESEENVEKAKAMVAELTAKYPLC